MIKKILKLSVILLFAGLVGFFTLPLPSAFFSPIKEFPEGEYIAFLPNKENKGERCLANTVYYSELNGYTKIGEGVVNPYCANLQQKLKKAIDAGNIKLVKDLISKGANINSPNNDYELAYPIVAAVRARKPEIVNLLLANGGNVDHVYTCCAMSSSILMLAVAHEDMETTKLLLSKNADIFFIDRIETFDVFDQAQYVNNPEINEQLEKACEMSISRRIKCRSMKVKSLYNSILDRHYY